MKIFRRIASITLAFTLVCSSLSGIVPLTKANAFEGSAKTFYVAKNGNDTNAGTIDAPFATLEKARDAIRELKNTSGLPEGGVTVYLREGAYNRSSSFELTEQDSGTETSPITYKAYGNEKVSIMGGYGLDTSAFKPVTDQAILDRIPLEAKDKVKQIDLKAQGITEYGQISKLGYGWPKSPGSPELFVNGKVMTVSRYPNSGFLTTGTINSTGFIPRDHTPDMPAGQPGAPGYVPPDQWMSQPGPIFTYSDSHVNNWVQESDPWLFGYWRWDWADDTVKIKSIDTVNKTIEALQPSFYGAKSSQRYYAFNMLCEIDMPGEWYLDRSSGILYLYPETDLSGSEVQLSVLNTPLVDMNKTNFVNFMDITLEISCGHGIKMIDSSNNKIIHCTLRRLGQKAIMIGDEAQLTDLNDPTREKFNTGFTGGSNNGIISCDIYEVGQGGIYILGGNRLTLTPGGNYVENCNIYNYARILRTYTPGIFLNGVGNRATNNLIHNAPHFGIQFNGNDHIIENNEIYSVCQETSDSGVIYSGRDWTYRGNIIRNNYIHDIVNNGGLGSWAIYLDDLMCSAEITGNIFYKIQKGVLLIGGGRDTVFKNNIMIDSGVAVSADNRGMTWTGTSDHARIPDGTCYKNLLTVPYKSEVWATKYPSLATILDNTTDKTQSTYYRLPSGNVVTDNVLYNTAGMSLSGDFSNTSTVKDNKTYASTDDVGFVDKANGNFALKPDSIIYKDLPNFKPISLDSIGLKIDEYRTSNEANIGDFYLTAPQNDATGVETLNATFQWQAANGAESYELVVAEDEMFSEIVVDEKLTGTSKVIDGLSPNKTYFWKVKASMMASSISGGKWSSQVYKFTTGETSDLTEDFENGFGRWWAEKGTPTTSNAQVHSGTNSYVMDEGYDVLTRIFSNYYNGVVSLWYYDNLSGATKQMATVQGGKWIGLGIDTSKTPSSGSTMYQVRIDGAFTSSGIARAKGWHKFTWDYSSGDHVDLSIDNQKVASTTVSKSFNKISFGSFWGTNSLGYYDDVKVENLRLAVTSVALNKTSMQLEIGNAEALTATVTQNNASNKNVAWKSGDETIASVDANGVVTAKAEGTATITVTTVDGGYTANCTVTVKKPMPKATLTVNGSVYAGEEFIVNYGLNTVAQSVYGGVYAQDITIKYNPNAIDFIGAQSVNEKTVITETYEVAPGVYRFVVASTGVAITSDEQILGIKLKAKDNAAGTETIELINIGLTDGNGTVIQAVPTNATIEVNKVDVVIDKTILNQMIAASQAKYDIAVEGTEIGQYKSGAKKILQDAIVKAQAVSSNEFATQAEVNAAIEELNSAITKFDSMKITERDNTGSGGDNSGTGGGNSGSNEGNIITDEGKITLKPVLDNGSVKGNVNLKDIEKALAKVEEDSNGNKTITMEIEKVEGAKEYVIELPSVTVSSENNNKKIELKTPVGTLIVLENMFKAGELKEDKVQLIISQSNSSGVNESSKGSIGERPVVELFVKEGDKILPWKNTNSSVTIELPYKPTQEELQKHEHIVVWYIDDQGKVTPVTDGKYNPATGKVVFTTTHFSKYAVAYNYKTFNDIGEYGWAQKQIEVLASKGVINGTTINTYSPEANIKRGDLILLLVKSLGLTAQVDSNFTDVKPEDYYYEALGIAKKLGIAKGFENNEFRPEELITRQDMIVLVERALRLMGKIAVQGNISDIEKFNDASQVSDYAVNSLAAMVKDGLIKGDGLNLKPEQNTTRAETAVLIYGVYNK